MPFLTENQNHWLYKIRRNAELENDGSYEAVNAYIGWVIKDQNKDAAWALIGESMNHGHEGVLRVLESAGFRKQAIINKET